MQKASINACSPADHATSTAPLPLDSYAIERCARIFRSLGDTSRLRLIARLATAPLCVGDLAQAEHETIATISQRLRVLRSENVVTRTRDGKHVLYSLADRHMHDLVVNGLQHAIEPRLPEPLTSFESNAPYFTQGNPMTTEHTVHPDHTHQHGIACGHTAIDHNGHIDFLHDGHLHHPHDSHIDEHALDVTAANPADCTDGHNCDGHDAGHVHGADCGHPAVPHGDHVDYLVKGHLHHPHNDHCDNHGNVKIVS